MKYQGLRPLQQRYDEEQQEKDKREKDPSSYPKRKIRLTRRRKRMAASKAVLLREFYLPGGSDADSIARKVAEKLADRLAEMDVDLDVVIEPVEEDAVSGTPAISLLTEGPLPEDPVKLIRTVSSLTEEFCA